MELFLLWVLLWGMLLMWVLIQASSQDEPELLCPFCGQTLYPETWCSICRICWDEQEVGFPPEKGEG